MKHTTFSRERALAKLVLAFRHWFIPSPAELLPEVIDVTERALKDVLPGYRIRLEVEKITVSGEARAPMTDAQFDARNHTA